MGNGSKSLREMLLASGRDRWLDVGCGGNFEEGFHYLDIASLDVLYPTNRPAGLEERYHHVDIRRPTADQFDQLGCFDLVRMQHTFEHFTFEEGRGVLESCKRLLLPGGMLLISVPDLRVHVELYRSRGYEKWSGYRGWAEKRVPAGAPQSFYFSMFGYSMEHEPHRWMYDYEALEYQVGWVGGFSGVRELKKSDPLAETPFTHNRPDEDVCLLAMRI